MNNLEVKLINPLDYFDTVAILAKQLNPLMELSMMKNRLEQMAVLPNYSCFGLFLENELIGISGGWTTVRIYCGKQLELDNVFIKSTIQSKGYGAYLMNAIKDWCSCRDYESISLNTYADNSGSHKFYLNQGFKILGFHFEHKLNSSQ